MASAQLLKAVAERLLDYEDKVRSAAIAAICDAAAKDIQVITTVLIVPLCAHQL
jgi:hypothetical protein